MVPSLVPILADCMTQSAPRLTRPNGEFAQEPTIGPVVKHHKSKPTKGGPRGDFMVICGPPSQYQRRSLIEQRNPAEPPNECAVRLAKPIDQHTIEGAFNRLG